MHFIVIVYVNLTCSARGTTPTAEQTEYRPPTQSQKPNTLSAEIPNSTALGIAELRVRRIVGEEIEGGREVDRE